MLVGRRGHARVVVLTVIEEEFDAVRQALDAHYEVGVTGALSAVQVADPKPTLPFVLIRSQDRSLAPTMASTRKAIEEWQPEVVLLVGIAGGITRGTRSDDGTVAWRDDGPQPGDIIVASYVHYAEYTKNVPSGTQLRYYPVDQPSSSLVQEHADPLRSPVANQEPWHSAIGEPRPGGESDNPRHPKVFIGEIIHVEGLAGDPRNAHQQWYLQRFDHAFGVDMESIGVARALHDARSDVHYNPTWMCVRAVSDRVFAQPEHAVDAGAGGPVASTGAAAEGNDVSEASDDPDNNAERAEWKAYAANALGCFTRRLLERLLCESREPRSEDPGADAFDGWEAHGADA